MLDLRDLDAVFAPDQSHIVSAVRALGRAKRGRVRSIAINSGLENKTVSKNVRRPLYLRPPGDSGDRVSTVFGDTVYARVLLEASADDHFRSVHVHRISQHRPVCNV